MTPTSVYSTKFEERPRNTYDMEEYEDFLDLYCLTDDYQRQNDISDKNDLAQSIYSRISSFNTYYGIHVLNLIQGKLSSAGLYKIPEDLKKAIELIKSSFSWEEDVDDELVDDIVVKMPPQRSYKVTLHVKEVRKGKPTIILPDPL
jgi:hypothetical protein